MKQPAILQEAPAPDFSLVLGGPLFQLFQRARLSGNALELLRRRILVITLFAWLPLFILSALDRHLLGGVTLPFFHDIENQVRFLIALPVLIAAELIVHLRLRPVVQSFIKRNIVVKDQIPAFHASIESATRMRNSIPLEVGLFVFVWILGSWVWRSQIALSTSSWYAIPDGTHFRLSPAGYWNAYVSIPIFQFILLRWYFRLLIWFRFLWQVSRLNLRLIPTHPDRAAGLAFLGKSSFAFAPVLFAQGAMLAGLIASRVLYGGARLLSFKMEAVGLIAVFILFVLGPLTMFTPQLADAKRNGLAIYGQLASRYVEEFQQKWVDSSPPHDDLLGAADIQSLADLGTSYAVVREMIPVPFGLQDVTRLALATSVPLIPLGLIIFSPEELVLHLIKVVF